MSSCWRCGWRVDPRKAEKQPDKYRQSGIYRGSVDKQLVCNVCIEERPALGDWHWSRLDWYHRASQNARPYLDATGIELGERVILELFTMWDRGPLWRFPIGAFSWAGYDTRAPAKGRLSLDLQAVPA